MRRTLRDEKTGKGYRREGALVAIDPCQMVVVGDIHGDLRALEKIIAETGIEKKFEEGWKLILLGDYADRGPSPLEVYSTLFEMKIAYPDNVFLLRGNHEAADVVPFQPHDLPAHIRSVYPDNWMEIYNELISIQGLLPVAAIIESWLILLHGGVFPGLTRTTLSYPTHDELKLILWSDPSETEGVVTSCRGGAGIRFNANVTKEVLSSLGVKHIIRSHQVIPEGYRFNHQGMVLTIISAKNVYDLQNGAFLSLKPFETLDSAIRLF
jgi:predicted phosphodiesterase